MGVAGYRTRPDGTVYPITRKKGAGAVAVVAAGAIAVGATSGGVVAGSGASGAMSSAMRAKVSEAKTAISKGRPNRAWRHLGLRRGLRKTAEHATCAALSYGAVRAFFVLTPCRSLRRMTAPLSDASGNSVVLAVSWVRMRSERDAARFKLLVDTHGTGNIAPIGRDALQRDYGVIFTGNHYDSDLDDKTVVVADAEPMRGHAPADLLRGVATVGVALPPPGRRAAVR